MIQENKKWWYGLPFLKTLRKKVILPRYSSLYDILTEGKSLPDKYNSLPPEWNRISLEKLNIHERLKFCMNYSTNKGIG